MNEKNLKSRVIPVFFILAISVSIATGFIYTRPTAETGEKGDPRIPVETMIAKPGTEQIIINTMGTVIPARRVTVQPEISGRIVSLSPDLVPGAFVPRGHILATIEPRDYELALDQQLARLQEAKTAFEIERGRQEIAREEWDLLQKTGIRGDEANALALRKPQLENVKAAVAAAESAVQQARLNLERTKIQAPFNAMVLTKTAELGQLVSPQQAITSLAGADTFWVQVSVPMKHLTFIRCPSEETKEAGSAAVIIHDLGDGTEIRKKGMVIQILTELTSGGRMASLIVEIDDPLARKTVDEPAQKLFLGAYVRIEIEGPVFENVYTLPRAVVHDGQQAWIMDRDDKLAIRDVNVLWSRADDLIVNDGLFSGDRIVTSKIPAPLRGILLKEFHSFDQSTPASGSEKSQRD